MNAAEGEGGSERRRAERGRNTEQSQEERTLKGWVAWQANSAALISTVSAHTACFVGVYRFLSDGALVDHDCARKATCKIRYGGPAHDNINRCGLANSNHNHGGVTPASHRHVLRRACFETGGHGGGRDTVRGGGG